MNRSILSRVFFTLVLAAGFTAAPRDICAQQVYPTDEDTRRHLVIQAGTGVTIPLMHLFASDDYDDGYARAGTMIIFRAYIPFKRRIDLMIDLALPRFGVDENQFQRSTGILIDEAFYKGKILSLGARWLVHATPSRRGFLMASAGMYQLIFDRFLNGHRDVYTIINGAYKMGGSFGGGMEFRLGDDIVIDGVLRYHNYTDTGYFGEGNLAWLELGLQFAFGGAR